MAEVVFVEAGGRERRVEVLPGLSVMEAALRADVEGIDGECGGAGICGTCHVWVDPAWEVRLPPAQEPEQDMIDGLDSARPNSRLSCQLRLDETLSGLVLRLPSGQ